MADVIDSGAVLPPRPVFACIRCSERKVKCDRKNPCETCTKHGVQCVFRPPKTTRRRRNHLKDKVVEERLQQYEALLRQNGIDPAVEQATRKVQTTDLIEHEKGAAPSGTSPPAAGEESLLSVGRQETSWNMPALMAVSSGPQKTLFKPRLIQGQGSTKFVDNSLWSRVAEEIHNEDNVSDEDDSAEDTDQSGASRYDFSQVLGRRGSRIGHPPPHIIFQLWQIFQDNVDPMLKMVHVPTLTAAMEKAAPEMDSAPRGFQALMFAIYTASILSMLDEEYATIFEEDRRTLLPRYVNATKAALTRADFMGTTSLVVLQALMLHILVIRNFEDPRSVWTLTGVALRIAEGMGMRVDGELLGLSPFETEIRRRIWWQIKMHDFRAGELAGQAKFRDFDLSETAPKRPLNIADTSLYPSMKEPAPEAERPTEMLWCAFRTELATFAHSQKVKMQKAGKDLLSSDDFLAMDDLKIKDEFLGKLQDHLELKYLRHCDPTQPLQLLTMVGGRAVFALMKFISHHPRRWTTMDHVPESEKEMIWRAVIQLLENYHMMQSNPQLQCFAWTVPYFIQWQAVIHILDTLRAQPLHQDAFKAWKLINSLYEENLDMLLNTKRPVFVAVGNLCLKAFAAREAAIKQRNISVFNTPTYIIKLREQRQAAKARKEAASARRRASASTDRNIESRVALSEATPRSEDTLVEAQAPENDTGEVNSTGMLYGGLKSGDGAFWLNDALDVGAVSSGAVDPTAMDIDTILTQDLWQNDVQQQSIDWGQWDAWLGAAPGVGPEKL